MFATGVVRVSHEKATLLEAFLTNIRHALATL